MSLTRNARHFYEAKYPGIDQGWQPGITTSMKSLAQDWAIPWASRETAKSAVRLHSMVDQMVAEFPVPTDDLRLAQHPAVLMLKGMPGRQRDAAAEAGTLVHKIAEDIALGNTPTIPDHLAGFARAFLRDFVETYHPQFHPLYIEAMVYHSGNDNVLPYGGTMDAFVRIGDETWLVDYKTTTDKEPSDDPRGFPYTDTALQLAAGRYAEFIGRPDDPKQYPVPKVTRCGVVAITPERAALIEYRVDPVAFECFAAARFAWEWKHKYSSQVKGEAA